MALAPVICTTVNQPTPAKAIYLDGMNVWKQTGNTTNPYGVQLSSVEVNEAAPGGVSSMTFVLDDPQALVAIQDGMVVRFHDVTNDVTIFGGLVQGWEYIPGFGQQGRGIKVSCIGWEFLLDSRYLPAMTLATGLSFQAAIQAMAAASSADLRFLGALSTGAEVGGSQERTVGTFKANGSAGLGVLTADVAITAGTTLRAGIMALASQVYTNNVDTSFPAFIFATVDALKGLRAFSQISSLNNDKPTDWTLLTITDTPVGAIRAENLIHRVNAAEIVRAVVVTGGNAAGSGTVTDGTGLPGAWASISDSTITTAAARDAAAFAYMKQYSLLGRGEFDLEDHTAVQTVHAGGPLSITDARAGLSVATAYQLGDITKTFNAQRQDWHITYGGRPPSAMAMIRRLTRAVLS